MGSFVALLVGCSRGPTTEPSTAAPPRSPNAESSRLPAPSPAAAPVAFSIADSIFTLINRERTRVNVPPLTRSAALMRAAQVHAEQMAAADRLAHELPRARYPTLAARLKLVGYRPRSAGENISEGFTSARAAIAGWMNSAAHRQNILAPRFTETGVGTARSKRGRAYHAQVFGRRLPAATR